MNALPDAMTPRLFRVAERRQEVAGVVTLELEADGQQPFSWQPGQFNMLYAFGVGEVPISISGVSADGRRIVHTIRAVGQVTLALSGLRVGEEVGVRGPFGKGWPLSQAEGRDLVIAAGGLGLVPLRPVILKVLEQPHRFGRVVLYYGTRNPDTILYQDELRRWAEAGIKVQITVDSATTRWRGEVGVVTRLMRGEHFDGESAFALLCGPEVMMRFSAQTLGCLGIAHDRIYLSMERNMQCGVGLCGHCQLGPRLVCRDGPVFSLDEVQPLMNVLEL